MAKRYIVSGKRRFLEFNPGETFWASLSSEWEARAIARGSIEPAPEEEDEAEPVVEVAYPAPSNVDLDETPEVEEEH